MNIARWTGLRLAGAFPLLLLTVALAALPGFAGGTARADILELTNGDVLVGEVLERTRRSLTFRYEFEGMWLTRTFDRRDYVALTEEAGDQSDHGTGATGGDTEAEASDPTEDAAPVDDGTPLVVTIPLHGAVGYSASRYFTHDALKAALETAEARGADLVILRIHSPGGLVSEMEAICELLLDTQARVPIVAWPRDALSAAALITLSCKDIVVGPGARIGAATIIRTKDGKTDALEAKFASPHYARQRDYMARSGHPYDVVAAMTIQSRELWWSPLTGEFTGDAARAETGRWSKLDDAESIFTMTGREAVEWKIAHAEFERPRDVAAHFGFDATARIEDLADVFDSEQRRTERRVKRMVEGFLDYHQSLLDLRAALVQVVNAVNGNDEAAYDRAVNDATRSVSRATRARRVVERVEHQLMGKRFDEPDAVIRRLAADKPLLSDLARALRQDSVDGVNAAVEHFNEVIEAWSVLFGG